MRITRITVSVIVALSIARARLCAGGFERRSRYGRQGI